MGFIDTLARTERRRHLLTVLFCLGLTVAAIGGIRLLSRDSQASSAQLPVVSAEPTAIEPIGPKGINLNRATQVQLEQLPGIGPVRAQAIIRNRPYVSWDDFLARSEVPKSLAEKLKDQFEGF